MQIIGRKIKFTREDVLAALRGEMVLQGLGEYWPEDVPLVLSMNTKGGVEVKPRPSKVKKKPGGL